MLRILIVCENASARFGGEAVLPLHYFRVLRGLGYPVWLITHARTREELSALFPRDDAIRYVEETSLHRAMWAVGRRLPPRLSNFTFGLVSRFATQLAQRRMARRLVSEERIDVVHQPIPVSPLEPSLMFGVGAPVVIGPMNGGMNYPPGFGFHVSWIEVLVVGLGRASASALNRVLPGKRRAALLLVANERTRKALPRGVRENVALLVENGVDLALWTPAVAKPLRETAEAVRFVFVGRLVHMKCVDLLLEAFAQASAHAAMHLEIIGDGEERVRLESLAASLGIARDSGAAASVEFAGWLSQAGCADRLRASDCLVLPSVYECGGAVVLEAMSVGKPVIATDWGGPADYLDHECGILVPPTSRRAFVEGLRDAMVRMARSPQDREKLGANGIAKVRREYDWDVKVNRMLDFYELAARGRKNG
jgi:glycosyltransferase involved in cell wall biosynthesis